VTKYLVTSIIASSTLTSVLALKPYTHIQIVPHLLHQWQWWRIPVWMASYSNAGEVLFACLAVYNLRGLERIFGSRKYAVTFSTRISRYWQIVLLDFFILCQFNSHTTPPWSDIPTIIIKQTQLSPSRANTYTILLTTIIHPSNSSKLHSPSRRFYTFTFLSIRSHRHRQMGSLRHLHPTRPLSISRFPNLRSNRVPNRPNVGILSPPRIHETLPSPP